MKSLIVSLALVLGLTVLSHAGGKQGQGWTVTVVTGTAGTVFQGRGYVKKVWVSSGTTTSLGDYAIFLSTPPDLALNQGVGLMGDVLFQSTTSVIPPLVHYTTTSLSNSAAFLNNEWDAGDCDTCFLEVSGDGGLFVRKSAVSSGEAGKAYIMWSR